MLRCPQLKVDLNIILVAFLPVVSREHSQYNLTDDDDELGKVNLVRQNAMSFIFLDVPD